MNYKDRTFCPYGKMCKNAPGCNRVLTDKIKQDAEAWGLPVAVFRTRPACFVSKAIRR